MIENLLPTVAFGTGVALVAFELFAAAISLCEVHDTAPIRREWGLAQSPTAPPPWFNPRVAVRTHFTAQRDLLNATRCRYPMLRSSSHARELRGAIRRLPRHAINGGAGPSALPAESRACVSAGDAPLASRRRMALRG
jgi:hypothetical protein